VKISRENLPAAAGCEEGTSRSRNVRVSNGTGNTVTLEKFVDIGLSATLTFLVAARDDRRAGNVAAANRQELGAHRAYQEALYLFRVLRPHVCQAGARRLAIRIKKIGKAMLAR
jgi:hypothetical protein